MKAKSRSGKGCWYRLILRECPVCGRDDSYKERMYTKKPKSVFKRIQFEQGYCGCVDR